MATNGTNTGPSRSADEIEVGLRGRPERLLIRPGGSYRHVEFAVRVGEAPPRPESDRLPLKLALVLDRRGSMAGGVCRLRSGAASRFAEVAAARARGW
jgi:hypothetical protein